MVVVKTGEYVTATQTPILRLRKVVPNTSMFPDSDAMTLLTLGYRKSRVVMSVVLAFELRKAHLKQKEKKKEKKVAGL